MFVSSQFDRLRLDRIPGNVEEQHRARGSQPPERLAGKAAQAIDQVLQNFANALEHLPLAVMCRPFQQANAAKEQHVEGQAMFNNGDPEAT